MKTPLFFFLLFCFFISLTGSSQTVAESPEGLFVALAGKATPLKPPAVGNYGMELKIYSTVRQAHIQSILLAQNEDFILDTLYFSRKGTFLVAVPHNRAGYLYNSITGKLLTMTGYRQGVAFSSDDSRCYLVNGNWVQTLDTKTGKVLDKYKVNEQDPIGKLYVTPDDNYLIGQSASFTWVWNLHKAGSLSKYKASSNAWDQERSILHVLFTGGSYGEDISVTSVLPASGKIIGRYRYKDLSKKILLAFDSLLRSQSIALAKNKKEVLFYEGPSSRLSTQGTFVAMNCRLKDTPTNLLLIVNTISKSISFRVQEGEKNKNFGWVSDSTFLYHPQTGQTVLANARHPSSYIPLLTEFEFGKSRNERIIPPAKQNILVQRSADARYLALPDQFKGNDRIYLKSTLIKQEKSLADSASFLGFSPHSDLLYFLSPAQHLGFIHTGDIEADLGHGILPKYFFADSLIIPVQGEIMHDPSPPPGYFFPRITSYKHISEANASTPLHVYLKTMGFDGKNNALMVHLIDTNGVYYYGAADSAWRKIWCNLLLSGPDSKIKQISDFSVTEYREDKGFYNAMCLAMDFSGSMGRNRGLMLQNGVLKFIGTKLEHEGIGVVKYDNRVVDECPVTADADMLKTDMNKTSYDMLARSTALLDALDRAMDQLNASSGYENKFIIILTDGCENASLVNKRYVIEKALKNHIRIFTIGLGDYVSEGYLKSLSYNTQGSYYRIYSSENLDWIYQDIRNKIKNYYTITFQTENNKESAGYKALLNICLDNKYVDTLSIVFDNNPLADRLRNSKLKDEDIIAPFSQVHNLSSSVEISAFKPIQDFSRIRSGVAVPSGKPVQETTIPHQLTAADSLQESFNALEFPSIKFEFDKTIIVKGTDEGIDNVVTFLKKHPKLHIEVEGHTDDRGSDEHNAPLSEARAEAVKSILVSKGIAADRIRARGYGSSRPLVKNDSEENRQINRRIDFSIDRN
ncbi:MAG TPA: OmpA family protein [Bacteroidia bacterium]|jgi:outer membrane protein OmpA-like peptidoglycan-associated protein/uncharacterized protein YegL|nr:OmpA family protein [Bacteroidia bacterium]